MLSLEPKMIGVSRDSIHCFVATFAPLQKMLCNYYVAFTQKPQRKAVFEEWKCFPCSCKIIDVFTFVLNKFHDPWGLRHTLKIMILY